MAADFTPAWRRPARTNDLPRHDAAAAAAAPPPPPPPWHRHPCLVCAAPPSNLHKRCSRCRAAVYCSAACQKQDYARGKHKANCAAMGKLWDEKGSLERFFWKNKNESTNPFDDEVYEYPTVGEFWRDRPATTLERKTTRYCVVMLQLVQLLGRGESWRTATRPPLRRTEENDRREDETEKDCRRTAGNPLARELAIDLAYRLLHLDRKDMRVRLLIPSLLLESGYYREAYDFLKHWLRPDASMHVMDLALMGGPGGAEEEEGGEAASGDEFSPADVPRGGNVAEPPEGWMDGEMVYPSVGMVFELAWLKCHLLCSLRSQRIRWGMPFGTEEEEGSGGRDGSASLLAEECLEAGEEELERQVRLLLSVVHERNDHLLPALRGPYDVTAGASSVHAAEAASLSEEGFAVQRTATPPASSSLLHARPPGFELQYRMGNPGGGTKDEAVAIWQRDVALWHAVDPRTMAVLSEFCAGLEDNLVDTRGLVGGDEARNGGVGDGVAARAVRGGEGAENVAKRREAEELAKKLQREKPERTMNEILMHPEMAQLMVKHLHAE